LNKSKQYIKDPGTERQKEMKIAKDGNGNSRLVSTWTKENCEADK
jgi:hypothetical protein